jgi:hypothetical protein
MNTKLVANFLIVFGGLLSLLYLAIVPVLDIPRNIINSLQYGKTGDSGIEGIIVLSSWAVLAAFAGITSYGVYCRLRASKNKGLRSAAQAISVAIAVLILSVNLLLSFAFGVYYATNN